MSTSEENEHSRKMPKGVKDGMIKVSGKDYLPVPFRLVWMRDEKPLWGISTEVIEAAGYTMVRATVTDETGRVIASAHKALTVGGKFPPIEKAETGAMGRALGAAGFGTQFGELDEEEPGVMGGIADSPVDRGNRAWTQTRQPTQKHNEQAYGQRPPNVDQHGEVHDGMPSRPPLSTKQQAMNDFRAAARAIDERYGHPSFKDVDMAKMVKAINEDGAAWEDVARNIPSWKYATGVLRSFKNCHPLTTAETLLKAIRFKFGHELPMVEFTATMWESPFPDSAQQPCDARIDAVAMMQAPQEVEA